MVWHFISVYIKQNITWPLGDIKVNTRREISYLCAAM